MFERRRGVEELSVDLREGGVIVCKMRTGVSQSVSQSHVSMISSRIMVEVSCSGQCGLSPVTGEECGVVGKNQTWVERHSVIQTGGDVHEAGQVRLGSGTSGERAVKDRLGGCFFWSWTSERRRSWTECDIKRMRDSGDG